MLHNLMHNKVLHERVLVVSVQVFDVPYVPEIDRVEIHKLKGDFYRVNVQYGFKDEPDIPAALALCESQGLPINDAVSLLLIALRCPDAAGLAATG